MTGYINVRLVGRFGNQLCQYAHARGYAERHNFTLRCDDWLGRKLFPAVAHDPYITTDYPTRTEFNVVDGESSITFSTYAMHQKAITYTREQAKRWFQFSSAILKVLTTVPTQPIVAHMRWGDFISLDGFIAISTESIQAACEQFSIPFNQVTFITEEHPVTVSDLPRSVSSFLPDFYRIMQATTIFRANSTFSWWAATLSNATRIFSPDLTGIAKAGQTTQFVPFVEGNHANISQVHSFCSDLYL